MDGTRAGRRAFAPGTSTRYSTAIPHFVREDEHFELIAFEASWNCIIKNDSGMTSIET